MVSMAIMSIQSIQSNFPPSPVNFGGAPFLLAFLNFSMDETPPMWHKQCLSWFQKEKKKRYSDNMSHLGAWHGMTRLGVAVAWCCWLSLFVFRFCFLSAICCLLFGMRYLVHMLSLYKLLALAS